MPHYWGSSITVSEVWRHAKTDRQTDWPTNQPTYQLLGRGLKKFHAFMILDGTQSFISVHKSMSLNPMLNQFNSVYVVIHYFSKTHFKIILTSIPQYSIWFLLPRFFLGGGNCVHFSSPMCTTCPPYPNLIELIFWTLGEECKLWSSEVGNFLLTSWRQHWRNLKLKMS